MKTATAMQETAGQTGSTTRGSIIGNLIRDGAATQIEGRRRMPAPGLRAALPGTALAYARSTPSDSEIAAQNMREFVEEGQGDADLRRAARAQGIDVEVWADQLEADEIEGRLSAEEAGYGE